MLTKSKFVLFVIVTNATIYTKYIYIYIYIYTIYTNIYKKLYIQKEIVRIYNCI